MFQLPSSKSHFPWMQVLLQMLKEAQHFYLWCHHWPALPPFHPWFCFQPTSQLNTPNGIRAECRCSPVQIELHYSNNPTNPHISLEVHLPFDSDSQQSYISERAQGLLHLDAIGEQSLSIATFGSHRGSVKVCPIVNVGLLLRGYPPMSLSLHVMPTVCEPLVRQPIATCIQKHSHLLGLELADFSSSQSSLPVDVLIGFDYYMELVTGSVSRRSNGPTAVHTKLGCVLSGPSSKSEPNQCAMNLSVMHVLRAETVSFGSPRNPRWGENALQQFHCSCQVRKWEIQRPLTLEGIPCSIDRQLSAEYKQAPRLAPYTQTRSSYPHGVC